MNDTPIAAMDATFYQHYAEELRLIVEDLLAEPALPARVWTAKRHGLLLGVCETQAAEDLANAVPGLWLWPHHVLTEATADIVERWSTI
ncbi:MAG: hypothetical protein IPL94_00085 [Tetrasphaera sp.]|nr:hypothetical protein [Tetrasphaera sp.]